MSWKMLVLPLAPLVAISLVGCGGSSDAARDQRSANPTAAAHQHAANPDEEHLRDDPSDQLAPQSAPSTTDIASPTYSSQFDPQRFELPETTEFAQPLPAPNPSVLPESISPESTPLELTPLELTPADTTTADSASPDPAPSDTTPNDPTPNVPPPGFASSDSPPPSLNPEPASQNPLRRAIMRPSATGANDLRSYHGFIDPKTAFAAPPRSPVSGEARLGDPARFPEPRIRPATTTPDGSNTTATETELRPTAPTESDPAASQPPVAELAPADTPPSRSVLPLVEQPAAASAGPPEDVDLGSAPEPAQSVREAVAADDPNSPFTTVKVFYATDRAAEDAATAVLGETQRVRARVWALALCVTALVGAGVCIHRSRRIVGGMLAMSAVSVAIFVWVRTADSGPSLAPESGSLRVAYRNERGSLEMGSCEVTIPKTHQEGRVERPQVWRFEFQERRDKHMILKSVERRAPDAFFDQVRDRVKQSPAEDLFVFVHGYNVSFETAALRTAQMAKDLEFQGAPIFYSWPSQGGLLRYTVDENNVTWTVPHLKQFLRDLAEESQAKAIHLIAHSMGNRALTAALREMAFESRGDSLRFQQIVLAAPDIDAEVFRRDIAPMLSRSADRVTLYASSNDQALAASKLVHGYPRAGDSGRDLVVVPGIETIDVSAADTSLLGHSYYGSSEPILHDLRLLIGRSQPAAVRPWLEPSVHDGHPYWVFDIRSASLGGPGARR